MDGQMGEKKFDNPHQRDVKKTLLDIILWQCGFYDDKEKRPKPPESFTYPRPPIDHDHNEPSACWINHSTYMIQVDGINILTDPIWGKRCSPVPFIGPKRLHPPAVPIEELPQIDVVLVSHDHYDHLCKQSVKKLHSRFPNILWYVPVGLKSWFYRLGISRVIELAWWEHSTLTFSEKGLELVLTAVPSQHFSGRLGWHSNNTHWAGWVVEFKRSRGDHKRLYFVGDTGYNDYDFKKIGERFGGMDLSLIPIGTYSPMEFMAPVHICPQRAVDIHMEVGSRLSLGMHWKTFKLSSEGLDQPPYDLYLEMEKRGLNPRKFLPVDPGERINW